MRVSVRLDTEPVGLGVTRATHAWPLNGGRTEMRCIGIRSREELPMTHTEAVLVARLSHNADVLGRLSYRLAANHRPGAARFVRSLRASQYARIRALSAH